METYPRAAVERARKVQEAMAKKITGAQAGEIIGLCERQMRGVHRRRRPRRPLPGKPQCPNDPSDSEHLPVTVSV